MSIYFFYLFWNDGRSDMLMKKSYTDMKKAVVFDRDTSCVGYYGFFNRIKNIKISFTIYFPCTMISL